MKSIREQGKVKMKKAVAMTLAVLSALITTQSVQARNTANSGGTTQQHHSGEGSVLTLGAYETACFGQSGAAFADTRNITVNGHSQQTVHIRAQSQTVARAFVTNLDTVTTVIDSTINFTVVKGNAKFLLITLDYIPHGGIQADEVEVNFLTPDSALKNAMFTEETLFLIDNGHGNYSVPVGTNGIPQGATLTDFSFSQEGNVSNCSVHGSDINHLQINRTFLGISTDPSASCGIACGTDGGGGEQ
jgi:hypothetical protein